MVKRIKRWLIKHASFDTYLKIARRLEPIEQKIIRFRYIFFTWTKSGAPLRGTGNPKTHRIFSGAIPRALPLIAPLALILFAPLLLPQAVPEFLSQSILECLPQPVLEFAKTAIDDSYVSGFIAAIFAIAGIFLTLFYTNATAVFSNKFPSSSGDVTKLFVELVSSDKDLGYCASLVVVAALSFVACAAGIFNWVAFLYFAALTLILISKLPNIFSLGTGKTGITAVSAIPANRFLTLARASSTDRLFSDSDLLILNFKKNASTELTMLDNLMEYSLTAGDYSLPYSRAVNEVVLLTLAKYSQISTSIDVKSPWHIESAAHKRWFMTPFHEVDLAISTGTTPQPDKSQDRFGYHKELCRISAKFGNFLIANNKVSEYSDYADLSRLILETCINSGDVEWAKEYSKKLLAQHLRFCRSISVNSEEDLQVRCHLLEQYAVTLLTMPLELGKLCDRVPHGAFHFDSFDTFSQAELKRQGFPLSDNEKMGELCKKLNYEKDVFDAAETPKWWFDKEVDSIGVEAIEQLCSTILLQHQSYCSTTKDFIASDPKSSYILALKEAELFKKSTRCLHGLRSLAETRFNAGALAKDHIAEIDAVHDELVRTYPELVESFARDQAELEAFFPDLYGFAFFNYCQLQFDDVINDRLSSFCSSIVPFYRLTAISSLDLRKATLDGPYSDIYKALVLSEPTILFIELCGMAYAMAELYEDRNAQRAIESSISEILKNVPKERSRWTVCVASSSNFAIYHMDGIDLLGWRRRFLDAVRNSERYPEVPRYPAGAISWKPPTGKERLLKMLPDIEFGFSNFSGCKIFEEYLLGSGNHDE